MRPSIFQLLYLLPIAFFVLYLFESKFKDLWVNLLASVITILFIQRLVTRSEIQKNERSERFVKATVADICVNLMGHLKPPSDWLNKINDPNYKWLDYFSEIRHVRTNILTRLETVLGRYGYLMESDFRNDVLDIVTMLNSGSWNMPFLKIEGATDITRLKFIIEFVVGVIHNSLELLKKYKLLESSEFSLRTKVGEPPQIDRSTIHSVEIAQRLYEYEQWLDESIKFKDKVNELIYTKSK